MNIIKGDKVLVTKGRDRGKSGKVFHVLPKTMRVVVEGVNLVKRATRAKRQGEKGQIVSKETGLRVENVSLICSACGKPTRIGMRTEGAKKVRFCKKCQATI